MASTYAGKAKAVVEQLTELIQELQHVEDQEDFPPELAKLLQVSLTCYDFLIHTGIMRNAKENYTPEGEYRYGLSGFDKNFINKFIQQNGE
ncbi:MAG: hypothetical protein ACOCZW_01330 [Bacteroidota bacterium]